MPRILIVDDDPAGRRLIQYMLSSEGHEVIAASNGILGLQTATQHLPDLVILDVMLPGLDGFEVCRRLRTSVKTANIPIVMLSGKAQSSDRDTGIRMGADEYFVKPVERKELVDTVNRLLGKARKTSEKKARLIAFIGARGGAGTSTVTVNVSVALEKTGNSTILVDMNSSYSALAEMVGLKAETSIAGLFKDASGTVDVEKMKGLFVKHSSGFRLLWAESYPDESDIYTADDIKTLFYELGSLADYIVADIPASPTDNAITVLNLADSVILVAGNSKESPERIRTSVTRLVRYGVPENKMSVLVVDRTGHDSNSDEITSNVSDILPVLGVIGFCENECAEAEAQGNPVILNAPSSGIAEDLYNLASRLTGVE